MIRRSPTGGAPTRSSRGTWNAWAINRDGKEGVDGSSPSEGFGRTRWRRRVFLGSGRARRWRVNARGPHLGRIRFVSELSEGFGRLPACPERRGPASSLSWGARRSSGARPKPACTRSTSSSSLALADISTGCGNSFVGPTTCPRASRPTSSKRPGSSASLLRDQIDALSGSCTRLLRPSVTASQGETSDSLEDPSTARGGRMRSSLKRL